MEKETRQEEIKRVLKCLRSALHRVYGDRLKEVILYGSWARGEGGEESDVDVAVVLEGEVEAGREIDRMMDVIDEFNMEYGILLAVYPVSVEDLQFVRSPLLLNIRREGVVL